MKFILCKRQKKTREEEEERRREGEGEEARADHITKHLPKKIIKSIKNGYFT